MKKISLTILRVIYMFGFPVFAHFGGHLIETKIKLFFFAALIIFYLGTFLIEKYFNKQPEYTNIDLKPTAIFKTN